MTALEIRNIKEYVHWAYKACPEIVDRWHVISGSGLDQCVQRSVEDFRNMDTLKFYLVTESSGIVGYFGSEYAGRYQPTIFIHPKYRDRKKEFWQVLQSKMQPQWKAGIYVKNTPCYKFYSKMGWLAGKANTPDGESAIFTFKRRGN